MGSCPRFAGGCLRPRADAAPALRPGIPPPPPGFRSSAGNNPAVQESNAIALSDQEQTAARDAQNACHKLLRWLTPVALTGAMFSVFRAWRGCARKVRAAHDMLEYETMKELQALLPDEKYRQMEENLRNSIRAA